MGAYLRTKVDGREMGVHQKVWTDANGPIPDGHVVHHVNHQQHDNRLENLQLMTHQEHSEHHNQKHAKVKVCVICGGDYTPHPTKRARQQTCSSPCMRQLMSLRALERPKVLSDQDVRHIRMFVAMGAAQKVAVRAYGVSPALVSQIVNRKRYAHVR